MIHYLIHHPGSDGYSIPGYYTTRETGKSHNVTEEEHHSDDEHNLCNVFEFLTSIHSESEVVRDRTPQRLRLRAWTAHPSATRTVRLKDEHKLEQMIVARRRTYTSSA